MLTFKTDALPLRMDNDGIVRVGNTRVTLQTVISAFHQGDSPEQIVDSFDVLTLAEVYAVIAYYLNHRAEIDAYIQEKSEEAAELRSTLEARYPDMFRLQKRLSAQNRISYFR